MTHFHGKLNRRNLNLVNAFWNLSTDRFTLFTFPGWSVLVRRQSFFLAQKWKLLLFPWACFGVPTGGPQPQAAPQEKWILWSSPMMGTHQSCSYSHLHTRRPSAGVADNLVKWLIKARMVRPPFICWVTINHFIGNRCCYAVSPKSWHGKDRQ